MEKHNLNICPTGDCPVGVEKVRKIGLTQDEKRAIFLAIIVDGEDGGRRVKLPTPISWGGLGRVRLVS